MRLFLIIICLICYEAQATTKVAIIDSFFCQKAISRSNIHIKKIQDMTMEKNPFGEKCEDTRQFHGQKVLRTFLDFYRSQEPLEIYLYKVFKKDGSQDTQALNETLIEISKENIDLAVMAIGFLDFSHLPKSLRTLTFASSGSIGNGISRTDMLWPQMLEDRKLVLFAHYFASKSGGKMIPGKDLEGHIDPGLLNLSRVNFLVASPSNPPVLSGSSFAVAKASGLILSRCSSLDDKEECFNKFSESVKILNSTSKKTFKVIQ